MGSGEARKVIPTPSQSVNIPNSTIVQQISNCFYHHLIKGKVFNILSDPNKQRTEAQK